MEVYYIGNTPYSSELYHHGILGQKWGVQNGPPYPLGAGDHSKREVKAGWKKSLAGNEELKSKRKKIRQLKKEEHSAYNKMYNNASMAYSKNKETKDQYETFVKEWNKASNDLDLAKKDYKKSKQIAKGILDKNGNEVVKPRSNFSMKVQETLGLNDEEYAQVKKIAKIAGISLATTAGIVAAGYLITKYRKNNAIDLNGIRDACQKAVNLNSSENSNNKVIGFNADRALKYTVGLNAQLFDNRANGDYIGSLARQKGYSAINADFLRNAIANPKSGLDPNELIQNVRCKLVDITGSRRLSCWSTSEAYFLSSLTGHEFGSKSFTNLVDFNDFGKLYNKNLNVFDIFGNKKDDFVGAFGGRKERGNAYTKNLVESIFKNVSASNNLTPDGERTIGFINAGYGGCTCTHQWNFEIKHMADGVKELFISDGYSGSRYSVAQIFKSGNIIYDDISDFSGFNILSRELHHYNADSIRFYAPGLNDLNLDMLSNVILGKL